MLQRARTVKRSTSIEPPLQVAELVPENEPLFSDFNGEKDTLSTAVESAAKGVFYANIVGNSCLLQSSTDISRHQPRLTSQSSSQCGTCLIFCSTVVTEVCMPCKLGCLGSALISVDICSAQLVLLLIEELLDSQSLAQCRTVFNFLESRREAIIAVCSRPKLDCFTNFSLDKLSKQVTGHFAFVQ